MRYLIVDGMFSGTGVRDPMRGEYVELGELGLSPDVVEAIASWLARYETAHYRQFNDPREVEALDAIGLALCERLAQELQGDKVGYFSDARTKTLKPA
ncbi:hypothetical protein G4G28_12785 [Massilia sp. Dwa41.01b]|uniref:hypothetical protein n=1 Tax=unclassified Massilia TaxID=2609279 RepID=UPI001600C0AA|nr:MULTISPECIES: hypothetical protein [unclassified Massilia]QNA89132.1 hypothetical protein G4G28_12785 [Massilia sp. Dwa41.01b]QNB00025.1 hypothetical protein G4G31_16360 [Massilia sp. Se16.2.3]